MKRSHEKITTVNQLLTSGYISGTQSQALQHVADKYAIAITPAIRSIMDSEAADGPVRAQFLPSPDELVTTAAERGDPIGDRDHSPVRGIVHRYRDRVLFKIVAVCPAYCRFCFRRSMIGPSSDDTLSQDDIAQAIAYIAQRPEIWEVIFSGGDPLILSARQITSILRQLDAIEHVKIIRWHSRVPVVAPETITDDLVAALKQTAKTTFVAVHSNHVSEHSPAMRRSCRKLIDAGVSVISQTVLLKNVNDSVEDLTALMKSFVEMGVKPYYLHQLDLAPGTSHFRVPLHEAREIVSQLRGHLSGLCQPTFMLDLPGGHGKVVAAREELRATDAQSYAARDFQGQKHNYSEASES